MKKLILLLAIAGFFTQADAQKLKAKQVPAAVTSAFYKAHPTAKDVDWSKHGDNYEAEYDLNKLDISFTYTVSGKLVSSEEEIKAAALPAAIMDYMKKNYKEDEVKKASKITNANGTVTYEIDFKGMDLIFDSNGGFIKSGKEKD